MQIEVVPVRIPLPRSWVMTPDWKLDNGYCVLVRIRDGDGCEGIGYAVMYSKRFHRALTTVTEALATLIEPAEVRSPELEWSRLRANAAECGAEGLASLALGAIDVALWDLCGKRAGLPVFRMLGATRERVEAYASATYFARLPSEDEYFQTAERLVAGGFKAFKFDFHFAGAVRWRSASERVKRMREFVGDEIELMIDCFQYWAAADVIRFGRELESCNLKWIEDPIKVADIPGYLAITDALTTPIASGEWAFSLETLLSWTRNRTTDIVIGDVQRIGGLTPWKRLAACAADNFVQLASHLQSEISVHALAASPTALMLEYSDWTFPLFANPPTLEDGALVLSEAPGLGLELDNAALEHYRCD
jgi:L-alanine-DL-glutamate epimerase-like enolase superfamily enzyme